MKKAKKIIKNKKKFILLVLFDPYFFQEHIILTVFRCQWGFQVLSELSTKSLMLIKVCALTASGRLLMDRMSEILRTAVIKKSRSSSQHQIKQSEHIFPNNSIVKLFSKSRYLHISLVFCLHLFP